VPDLLTLGDLRTRDPAVAGAKAAGLANATARGLPVEPGVVVPIAALLPATTAGRRMLGRSAAAARLAVAGARIDHATLDALRAVCTGFRHGAIVRSSSPLERDPRWSGAFATYHEVGLDDLPAALLGCVASLFSSDALARARQMGLPPADLSVAALIQPWLPLDGGGTASVAADDDVTVRGVHGDPVTLVSGHAQGWRATVAAHGGIGGDPPGGFAPDVVSAVADLARRVHHELGDGEIEWGSVDGEIRLLQVRRSVAVRAPASSLGEPPRPPTSVERRLAKLAQRFPGPVGELAVLSWGVALDETIDSAPIAVTDPAVAYAEIIDAAAELRAHVWRTDRETAGRRWAEAARLTLAGDPRASETLALDRLRRPDPAVAATLVGSIRGLADALVAGGALPHPEAIWRVTLHDLELASRDPGRRVAIPQGPDRWEPLVASVVVAEGQRSVGVAVSPGVGVGPAHPLVEGAGRPGPRAVLFASRPVPQIAPLLWGSAGLVTTEGSEGAHLFEVARSLGVPAVTSLCLSEPGAAAPGSLVAVDGDRGVISVLEGASATELPMMAEA
jgi:phosphohistidine swiveling domain-containing protein